MDQDFPGDAYALRSAKFQIITVSKVSDRRNGYFLHVHSDDVALKKLVR